MLGFAAGVMTAASVWSLLLPAIDQAAEEGKVPGWLPAAAGMLLGVVFLAALDALLPRLRREKEVNDAWRQNTLLMTAITLHNVPEGMAVGLAFALAAAGEEVAEAFGEAFSQTDLSRLYYRKENGKYQLDLWRANEIILQEAGIAAERIQVTDLCTCHNSGYLFSHRASQGNRGNLGPFLGL